MFVSMAESNYPPGIMTKQMCWYSSNSDEPKQLYLRETLSSPWKHYKETPHAVPDYLITGGSEGYSTMQVLFSKGWKPVSNEGIRIE